MLVLGISGLSRQPTAALLHDGELVAACEEAKLIGRRGPRGVPHKAIAFCLKKAGASADDVAVVALDLQPLLLSVRGPALGGKRAPVAPLGTLFQRVARLARSRPEVRDLLALRESFADARFVAVDHHHAHAAYAYYHSPFERALVLTLDNGVAARAAMVATARPEKQIRPLASARFPHSVGLVYSAVTELLGWDPEEDVHRAVWLSTTGEPEFAAVFREIFDPLRRGDLRPAAGWFSLSASGRIRLSESFLADVGLDSTKKAAGMPEAWRANLAASLQTEAEAALVELAEFWRRRTKAAALCLGGDVALNALLADALATRTGFRDGFIPPAAGSAGCAVGAAMAAAQDAGDTIARPNRIPSAALGPAYSGQEIKDILDNCRLRYRHLSTPQIIQAVAELLDKGSFVGWFQGAAEFGPRALGHRSILAAPRDQWVKENLNAYTKRRERFRPLAASVTEEDAPRYFEFRWPATAAYLASVARVKDPEIIPGLAFAGDRARIHTVSRAANKNYHDLLLRVRELTGHPVLINTSFNEPGAPLAATPGEALRVFYSSGVDALAIGNFLITK